MKTIALILLMFAVSPISQVWAHGEDRPGPHGGVIRMPGAFHTEVLALDGGFKVLLLDIALGKPSVSGGSVRGRIVNGDSVVALQCAAHSDHFFCETPRGSVPDKGELILDAARGGEKEGRAVYPLPLALPSAPGGKHNLHHH